MIMAGVKADPLPNTKSLVQQRNKRLPSIGHGNSRYGSSTYQQRSSKVVNQLPLVDMEPTKLSQVYSLLQSKLLGGHYHAIHHAFKTVSPQGNGLVTRCALYRLLCNFVSGLTIQIFNMLLKRINLDSKTVISFEDFFSKFRVVSDLEKGWLYPVARHSSSMPWQFVYSQLQKKARNGLSKFWSNGHQYITKSTLKQYLTSVCLNLKDDQYDILWNRLDQECNGWLTLPVLLKYLDVDKLDDTCTPSIATNAEVELLKKFEEMDPFRYGKVSSHQLHSVLSKAGGTRLSQAQLQTLLQQLGFTNNMVDYRKFISYFTSRAEGSLTDNIMTMALSSKSRAKQKLCKSSGDSDPKNSIVLLLQSSFLKLLAALQGCDRKNSGYITKEDFKSCVLGLCSCKEDQLQDLIDFLCKDAYQEYPLSKVPYPKFLAMFDSGSKKTLIHKSKKSPTIQSSISSELLKQVTSLVASDRTSITEHFISIDEYNTGKLTFHQFFTLFIRCGIDTTKDELVPLWDSFLKNKDGTISFHQLLKELSRISGSNSDANFKKRLTEDHCFMRSKTLHRDEDMLQEALRYKVVYYGEPLLQHIASISSDGCLSIQTFKKLLRKLCPAFTQAEIELLIAKFQDTQSSSIDCSKFFSSFHPMVHQLTGVKYLLSHQGSVCDVAKYAPSVLPLACKPNLGVPGIKRDLQRQLTKKWIKLRQLLRNIDSAGKGNVTITNFKMMLEECDVQLDSEQLYQVLEALDPNLSGFIHYPTFFNIIFDAPFN